MMEPGRGSSSAARRLPSSNCFSSLKRWKREEAWMTEMQPRSSVRVFTDATGGGEPDSMGAVRERCASSNASPARNLTGKVSGVVLNSSCPRPQNPVPRTGRYFRAMNVGDSPNRTCSEVRRKSIRHWPPVMDNLSHLGTHYPKASEIIGQLSRQIQRTNWSLLQHPMSRNIASGRFFPNLRTRGYAGIPEILSLVKPNPKMQG